MNVPDPATLVWRKSSRSGPGAECVEVAPTATGFAVRDSKDPGGSVLTFGVEAWRAFLDAIKNGEFVTVVELDPATMEWQHPSFSGGSSNCVELAMIASGPAWKPTARLALRDSTCPRGPLLFFTAPEWSAFVLAVKAGEFG